MRQNTRRLPSLAAKTLPALAALALSVAVAWGALTAGATPTQGAVIGTAAPEANAEALGESARVLELSSNPLAGVNAAAPARLAYDLPDDVIVQIGLNGLHFWSVDTPPLDKTRMMSPWMLMRGSDRVSNAAFTWPDDSVRYRNDLRDIPLNRHGLPDLGDPGLRERLAGSDDRLTSNLLNDIAQDPDWARWIAGRYELVVEYPKDEALDLRVVLAADPKEVEGPTRMELADGHVREVWTMSAPLGPLYFFVEVQGGDTAGWRRLDLYHTHDVDGRPTGDRKRHEAGNVWSERWLRLFADRYDAVRFMDLTKANTSAETAFADRCELDEEGPWTVETAALPFFNFPWDHARHLNGEHCAGVPIAAMMRLTKEASLVARERGREGHVLNPQAFVPQRYEMPEIDRVLDVIAEGVAEAAAAGVDYDYVKLSLGNEIWNSHPGGFRDDHCYFAGYPKTRYQRTQERDPRYEDLSALFEATEPWYTDWDELQSNGCVSPTAAMASAARRMIHVLSRAHARHPDINWIGDYSAWTVADWTAKNVFEGARDGAADVARWAREGDERGSTAYAVIPDDEEGRPAVGALFTYSLTTYHSVLDGPGRTLFAGLPHDAVARRAEAGTLNGYVRDRFLTVSAEPSERGGDRALYDSLAGMRRMYQRMIDAVAAEGGAMIDFYEGGSHFEERHDWPQPTKEAFRAWKRSDEFVEVQDAIHDMTAELGMIGVTDFAFAGKDENRKGESRNFAPWVEETDPYTRQPWERLWAKRMTPLVPTLEGGAD